MTYPPGIMSSFVVCENYVSELCTLTYERTVPFSPMFTTLSTFPSQVQFDNICYHLLFQYTPLRQNDILHIDY